MCEILANPSPSCSVFSVLTNTAARGSHLDWSQLFARVIADSATPGSFSATFSEVSAVQTSVYTMPGKIEQGKFCLATASKALDYLEVPISPTMATVQQMWTVLQRDGPLSTLAGVNSGLLHSRNPSGSNTRWQSPTSCEVISLSLPLLAPPKRSSFTVRRRAIPDFAAGAMENWGCVTYREAKILTDVGTSLAMKKGIARTVCHELAHMWFGNLATMEWWNALFLNEGFARYGGTCADLHQHAHAMAVSSELRLRLSH